MGGNQLCTKIGEQKFNILPHTPFNDNRFIHSSVNERNEADTFAGHLNIPSFLFTFVNRNWFLMHLDIDYCIDLIAKHGFDE